MKKIKITAHRRRVRDCSFPPATRLSRVFSVPYPEIIDQPPNLTTPPPSSFRETRSITYNSVNVDVIIDKPALSQMDVLITYHGTVQSNDVILSAAENILDQFKNILNREDMMIVSVAHPQVDILFGDNIAQAEAALLWVKNQASQDLGITVNKIFLAGHSQGGYLVTRLNVLHQTNGVIANAPGPLNLLFRCELEEDGKIVPSYVCNNLINAYGTTDANPNAYNNRSLLNFTNNYKSDILFVQGLNDSPIQMYSWPTFKEEVLDCTNCQGIEFFEVVGGGHASLFQNQSAKDAFNNFINIR